jgi:hypothetical protein
MVNFGPEEALQYAQDGLLEDWVHKFLTTAGSNLPLSLGLKKQARWWLGPRYFPLTLLERCCGPEEGMEYRQPTEDFEKQVNAMAVAIQQGWQPPPMIVVWGLDGILSVRDGNHRLEALLRSGLQAYWVVFWFNTAQDKEAFLDKYP